MEYKEFEKRVLDIRSLSNKPLGTKIKKLFNDISIPMQLPVGMPSETLSCEQKFTQKQILDAVRKELTDVFGDDYEPEELKDKIYTVHGYIISALRTLASKP